ncbi:hypothetical protein H0H81_004690 [Sphagnurus paluster]|uniref:MFS general substrate transporter n=1 Tax=Sphagnurus paluster TaxID=117069 RepID=A0A9P7GQ20_9AGAR|nr:hypothetical protein H0H81_004690 [Sphagnurus paluster]
MTTTVTNEAEKDTLVTPLPKLQLFIIIFIQIAEPVTSTVIYPFVNNLVRTLGITNGDEKKTGYYVGLIESIFYAAEALTVLNWGRASDRIGRRPILLGGMLGLTMSMFGFGLSNSSGFLVPPRGLVNRFYSWSAYTLPAVVARKQKEDAVRGLAEADETSPTTRLLGSSASSISQDYGATAVGSPCSTGPSTPVLKDYATPPPPFRELLIARVLIPITNFAFLAFLDQSVLVLLPLIYSTPMALGGLGLSPSAIGSILGVWGVINGFVQVLCFAGFRRRVGHRTCYMMGIGGLGVCFALFPLFPVLLTWDGGVIGPWVWLGIVMQLTAYMFSYISYACMFMYIAASAPSRSALGATNGLAQLTVSSVRALAPTTASSLFSLSLELGAGKGSWFGGYLVYMVLCGISSVSLWWSCRLPKELGGKDKEPRRERSDDTLVY